MKGIILAAGEGKRLRPFTDNNPKCLIPLEGKSILDRQIDTMRSCGIDDIVVIKGYRADQITRQDVRFRVNPRYDTTNMVMTLWCAEKDLCGEVVVSYGDIVYNREVLEELMKSPHDISVVADMDWLPYWTMRFSDPLSDAEAFKMDADGRIMVIGQKPEKIEDIEAGYIGLNKFSNTGLDIFKRSFVHAQRVFENNGKAWGAPRAFEKAYMTDMLQGLINEGNELHAVRIHGGWLEIDSYSDYELAGKLFTNGRVRAIRKGAGNA
ncbi:MAG: phosphocholine cytidylyltransferase family protein [Candidatus Omnitrophica bacterium]|nr:phosphocholine cytidylyltransferase family protein [Candidatus Omnitrophota bacterium]MDD5774339.1 phosphocholine cytidylyltransferase family protein [Candidatus Omnitrophota bacterium]